MSITSTQLHCALEIFISEFLIRIKNVYLKKKINLEYDTHLSHDKNMRFICMINK